MQKKILITGAYGRLGKALLKEKGMQEYKLFTPTHKELDITNKESINSYYKKNKFDMIVHLAALTDMKLQEENPSKAIEVNYLGTLNIIEAIKEKEKVEFFFISTDYVYPCVKGPYRENDATGPFTIYGWTKLAAEQLVKGLPNHCIIRTSFFNKNEIVYDTAPSDAFVSKITFEEGAEAISLLIKLKHKGIINVGQKKISLYELYRKYKPEIKAVSIKDIPQEKQRAKDSSLNIELWEKTKGKS